MLICQLTLTPIQAAVHFFSDEVSELWMQSLVDPKVRLSFEQRLEVIQTAMTWLKLHKPEIQTTTGGQGNV